MKILEYVGVNQAFANPVLTIGNYDGLHVGHRQIITKTMRKARELGGTAMLLTFDPHPLTVVRPERHVHVITPIHMKKQLIEESGIDVLYILPFTEEFRGVAPEAFVEDILVGKIGIKGLIIGFDFRFGKGGRGDVEMLKRFSQEYNFFFEAVDAVTIDGEKIGSNRIRRMIAGGDVEKAELFLGRPYMIEGTVVKGKGRGSTIGFPTLNLRTDYELIPEGGVYITEVQVREIGKAPGRAEPGNDGDVKGSPAATRMPAVTNIGYNPTFGDVGFSIETHLIGENVDLYGKEIALFFLRRLREEIKFSCVDALYEQIHFDVARARDYFATKQS
jgi:riboflavin kinase/FMN adenylyltransferase